MQFDQFPKWDYKLGGGMYKGIFTQQHKNFYEAFRVLFKINDIKQVLEIGTANGGLTCAIRDLAPDVTIRTYDIVKPVSSLYLKDRGVELVLKDMFEDFDNLHRYINKEGQTLVLCDGGNKPAEFKYLAKMLKPGDIIMAHDYCVDDEYFNSYIRDHVWAWCEIKFADIQESTKELTPHLAELFQEAVWTCWKK